MVVFNLIFKKLNLMDFTSYQISFKKYVFRNFSQEEENAKYSKHLNCREINKINF